MKALKTFVVFLLFLIATGPASWADSTPNVPVDDPVYRDIDKLIAAGLVRDVVFGQRPWTRAEIARMVAEAIDKHADLPIPMVPDEREISLRLTAGDILERLKSDFKEEMIDAGDLPGDGKAVRIHPLEEVRFDATLLDGGPRPIPLDNGLGGIVGGIQPLVSYREGRHYAEGGTLGLETVHRVKLSRFFSLYARPRFEGLFPTTGSADVNPLAQQLYAKFGVGKFQLQVGRDSLIWGQGEFGGLIFSNNARPLDMIKLGTSSPVILPWIFRYLGQNGFQIFFADMGPEQLYPHAILSGFKWTIVPVSFWELGLNHVVMMGGDGANDPSVWEAIGEFSGILSAFTGNKGNSAFTNRLFSLETRLTLPFLSNSVLYGEIGFDDTNSEFGVLFEDNAIYYAGFYVPRLFHDGTADLRVEYRHVPGGAYRHFQYTDGYTLNRRLLADQAGPDGQGVNLKFNVNFAESSIFTIETAYENRDSDLYTSVSSSGNDITDIVKTQDNPTEHRIRLDSAVSWYPAKRVNLKLDFGYEYCRNFNFHSGEDAHHFRGGLTLVAKPLF